MFNNAALDVVIGLVFIYLLYSLLGTLLQEMVATNIGLRGTILQKAIVRMLNDQPQTRTSTTAKSLSKAFYDHPLIKSLRQDSFLKRMLPAYMKKETFSKVLVDLLRGNNVRPGDSSRTPIQNSLDTKKIAWDPTVGIDDETLSYLRSIWTDAQGDVDRFKELLEKWYDEMMDRTTGWYKKAVQKILFVIGIVLAIGFNVDTITIATKLQKDPKLRAAVVAQATEFTKAHPNLEKELKDQQSQIDSLNARQANLLTARADAQRFYDSTKKLRDTLYSQAANLVNNDIMSVNNLLGLGYPGEICNNIYWYTPFGWILTALAISLGAPFWFDLLNKLMKLRSSVAPTEEKSPKSAKDAPKTLRVG